MALIPAKSILLKSCVISDQYDVYFAQTKWTGPDWLVSSCSTCWSSLWGCLQHGRDEARDPVLRKLCSPVALLDPSSASSLWPVCLLLRNEWYFYGKNMLPLSVQSLVINLIDLNFWSFDSIILLWSRHFKNRRRCRKSCPALQVKIPTFSTSQNACSFSYM